MRRHVELPIEGSLLRPEAWDLLRTSADGSAFAFPPTREQWIARCEADARLADRARAVLTLAGEAGASGIASYGVGVACLEYHLRRQRPGMPLRLSDYAPATVERLRLVFGGEADISVRDLLRDPIHAASSELVLLHRVDTEFSDTQWDALFCRMHEGCVEDVLLVPTEFLRPRSLVAEGVRRTHNLIARRRVVFAGFLRTREVFESFWQSRYRVHDERECDGVSLILLRRLGA